MKLLCVQPCVLKFFRVTLLHASCKNLCKWQPIWLRFWVGGKRLSLHCGWQTLLLDVELPWWLGAVVNGHSSRLPPWEAPVLIAKKRFFFFFSCSFLMVGMQCHCGLLGTRVQLCHGHCLLPCCEFALYLWVASPVDLEHLQSVATNFYCPQTFPSLEL